MNAITNKTTIGTNARGMDAEDPMSTMDLLIRAFRAHTHGRGLPAPGVLSFSPLARRIDIEPDGRDDLARQLANLLLWAHTLSDVTATWTRLDSGRFHVAVTGRTAIGARVRVYCLGLFTDCAGLVALDPGQTDGVSLDELFALACLLREHRQNGGMVAREGAGKEVDR